MKFYSQILALCALQGTSAFVVQPHKATASALNAFSYGNPGVETFQSNPLGTEPPASPLQSTARAPQVQSAKDVWETLSPITVQGSSLRTWSITTPSVERVQVLMKTEGRPLNANVELWHGPDNTPQKMNVYIEDGSLRPFSCVVETPRGPNAIAIYNTGHLEFPLAACVEAEVEDENGVGSAGLKDVTMRLAETAKTQTIQGGALKTFPFDPTVASVQILLKTDGRPLNSRIELLQGPNNNKQVIEIYTEDGMERPFFMVIETPGVGNVVRIVNTATVEFPLTCAVEPYLVSSGADDLNNSFFVLDGEW